MLKAVNAALIALSLICASKTDAQEQPDPDAVAAATRTDHDHANNRWFYSFGAGDTARHKTGHHSGSAGDRARFRCCCASGA